MKYQPHGSVLFCTCSLEEELLRLAHSLCQATVESCLAEEESAGEKARVRKGAPLGAGV
jgi:hypothetical protein